MPLLTLYSRQGCHLCEEMKAVLHRARTQVPFDFEEVDVSTDPALERQYGQQIPVLFVDGRLVARYRVKEEQVLRQIRGSAG